MPRPRFTLRVVLAVTTIVAVVMWRHVDWRNQRRDAVSSGRISVGRSVAAPGLLRLFGASGYNALLIDPAMDAQEIQHLRSLFPEAAYPYGRIGEF